MELKSGIYESLIYEALKKKLEALSDKYVFTDSIDSGEAPYILSKPIHKSQSVVEEHEDGSVIVSIKVIPNYELEQLLLSFGERIKILSPDSLRNNILARIKKNIENYK